MKNFKCHQSISQKLGGAKPLIRGIYDVDSKLKFSLTMLRLSVYDNSDSCILVEINNWEKSRCR